MNILFCFLTLLLYCVLYLSLNFSNAVSTENKPWGSWIGVGHLGLVKWLPGTLGVGKAIWSFNFYMFFFSVSLPIYSPVHTCCLSWYLFLASAAECLGSDWRPYATNPFAGTWVGAWLTLPSQFILFHQWLSSSPNLLTFLSFILFPLLLSRYILKNVLLSF